MVMGWDKFVPRIKAYAEELAAASMTVAINDELWSAIGDPTRRRMLDLLLAGARARRPR